MRRSDSERSREAPGRGAAYTTPWHPGCWTSRMGFASCLLPAAGTRPRRHDEHGTALRKSALLRPKSAAPQPSAGRIGLQDDPNVGVHSHERIRATGGSTGKVIHSETGTTGNRTCGESRSYKPCGNERSGQNDHRLLYG